MTLAIIDLYVRKQLPCYGTHVRAFRETPTKALSYLVLTVVGFRNTVSQTGIIVENPLSVSYQVSSSRD